MDRTPEQGSFPRVRRGAIAVLIAAALTLTAAHAWSADLYVSPTGVDPAGCATTPNDGIGSDDPPYLTIQKALNCAANGDIIHVAAGTYTENLQLTKTVTMLGAQAGVNACARVASETIVSAANPAVEALQIIGTGATNAVIDGFTFRGTTTAFACVQSIGNTTNGMQFKNNRVREFVTVGVYLNKGDLNGVISGNEIDGTSQSGNGSLIQLDGPDQFHGLVFLNNCIQNTANTGLFCDGTHNWTAGSGATQPPAINGNTFKNCVTAINLGSRSYNTTSLPTASISNNVFMNCSANGLQGGPQNTNITGNLFQNNGEGIALTSFGNTGIDRGGQNCSITGNTFTGNTVDGLFLSASQAAGTISTNQAHNNDFLGTGSGVRYLGSETINLTCNWWGDINGPNYSPSNVNPAGSSITGTNMTFSPWLNGSITGTPICNQTPDKVKAITTGLCISNAHPCVNVPFTFTRVDASNARGISVTFTINTAKLALCVSPAASIHQGTWLAAFTNSFQVIDNGGGSYTVDQAILGLPCGQTAGGQLFTVDLKNSDGDGTGVITITNVTVRDCNNLALPGSPGPPANIPIQVTNPAPITDLAATQVLSGNGAGSTTGIRVTWATGGAGTVSLYRAPFGSYPEYDDDAVVTPPSAAAAPGAPWVLVSASATSPYVDAAAARGFWYYVAFVKDACDNVSAVSNSTTGTLDYLLGDVTPAPGAGDNKVDGLDISLLGFNYGLTGEGPVDAVGYLDVGPTLTGAANARPKPDDKINFEDLVIFAINYGGTGLQIAPERARLAHSMSSRGVGNVLALDAPKSVQPGETFVATLRIDGVGDIQALSSQLGWDASVAAPVSVDAGALLTQLGGVAMSSGPGDVDVALLGAGPGISGSGDLARVTFRAIAAGNPGVTLARTDARNALNQKMSLTAGVPAPLSLPTTTEFRAIVPNPFNGSAEMVFALAQAGPVELAIYSVDGRRVRTLASGPYAAGEYRPAWDGKDDSGHAMQAGLYFARLTTAAGRFTKRVTFLNN